MDRVLKQNPFTKAVAEIALWDLLGKAAGVPVFQFLGGRLRDEAPIKMVVVAFEVNKACALAERLLVGLGADDLLRSCSGAECYIGQ